MRIQSVVALFLACCAGPSFQWQAAAQAVKNRHPPRKRKTVCRQYLPDTDVPVFRPRFFYGFCHARPLLVVTLIRNFSAFSFRAAA